MDNMLTLLHWLTNPRLIIIGSKTLIRLSTTGYTYVSAIMSFTSVAIVVISHINNFSFFYSNLQVQYAICLKASCTPNEYTVHDINPQISGKLCVNIGGRYQESRIITWNIKCGGTYTNDHGYISTPNYPHSYPADIVCKWTITVGPEYSIKLLFNDFYTFESDFLSVYNGDSDTSPLLGCGGELTANEVIRLNTEFARDLRINVVNGVLVWSTTGFEANLMQSNLDGSNETLMNTWFTAYWTWRLE
ncbi:unnamed protein product [Oppiella nova]|uniref:CUB domain-containing protein n=1 Tax=Oppiella nova TaxID=334625 RepID=A0A7R9M285_9ACAR|nr:unnamed protein product [Oppiella nova]CAG2168952.1 unnamed protein product [Oppiella nova]